jgi:large subunit ribosomal protein L24
MKTIFKIKLKKGDNVVVRTGKYKGQSGKITATHPTLNAVTVEGINVVKKHVKPNRQHPQGDIVELTKPIAVSKVQLSKAPVKKSNKEKK